MAWPGTLFLAGWLSRKHLAQAISFLAVHVERLRHGDTEIVFRKTLEKVSADICEDSENADRCAPSVAEDGEQNEGQKQGFSESVSNGNVDRGDQLDELLVVSPGMAVVEAWKLIEISARNRIEQDVDPKTLPDRTLTNPIRYLNNIGVLTPVARRSLRELNNLRNRAAHTHDIISSETAAEYVRLARIFAQQIAHLPAFPKIKLAFLGVIIFELTHLIDTGMFSDITIEDVYAHMKSQDLIPWLAERTKGQSDFSIILERSSGRIYLDTYHQIMANYYNCYGGGSST